MFDYVEMSACVRTCVRECARVCVVQKCATENLQKLIAIPSRCI